MNWPQKRIGNFLIESSIETSAPSADRRIRVLLNAEGIEKRPLIAETEGATRYFQRKAGQFIYGKQNLHKGAFGVVPPELDGFESSSDLPAFDVADGLRPKWLEYFLKQGNFYKSLVAIAKGAATKRIQPEALFDVELPVPPTKVQDEIIKRMDRCALEHTRLEHEITHEQCLLTKLKQAILQEAIQGKLTADWRRAYPDVEPASQLLRRIQGEKAHLIAAKKLRPEKPLPKITPEEIPFEIPTTWEWCVLDELASFTNGKAHEQIVDPKGNYVLINSRFVSTGGITKKLVREILTPVSVGDLALVMSDVPDGRALGRCFLVDKEDHYTLNQRIGAMRMFGKIDPIFAHLVLNRNSHFLSFNDGKKQTNLKKQQIVSCPFPLPPLAEQAAIVARVETLLGSSRLLAAEIAHTRIHAAHLLQAVLKEAFSKTS